MPEQVEKVLSLNCDYWWRDDTHKYDPVCSDPGKPTRNSGNYQNAYGDV